MLQSTGSRPLVVYLTSRTLLKGEVSRAQLLAKGRGQAAHGRDIRVRELDVTSAESVNRFASRLSTDHPQGIDVLVNNAGVAQRRSLEDTVAEDVRATLACNYYGTLAVTRALEPLLRRRRPFPARVVNMASRMGMLGAHFFTPDLATRFRAVRAEADATALMREYQDAVASGKRREAGFPGAYRVSKAGVIALTRALAAEFVPKGILCNSCCPGYVATDMTGGHGNLTPDQGARTTLLLAIGDIGGRSGGYWSREKEMEW